MKPAPIVRAGLFLWALLLPLFLLAQPKADTADKIKIIIANTGVIEHYTTDSGSYNKFVNDVVVYQGTDTLYCDSLYQYIEKKKLEAFGDVRIAQQGGTGGTCSYLRYASDKRLAYMTGDVLLTDGKNRLWAQELNYNLDTKTGTYNNNGTLQSDSTIVTSIYGVYNVKSHDARFTGNVLILDPQYKIQSKDLGYNTETRVQTFYDYSVVTADSGKSILTAYSGTYDSRNVVARFTGHSSMWTDGQYIEADTMHYNKHSGYGFAQGHVISLDTTKHATIFCGRIDYFRRQKVLWAVDKPVLELVNGRDTFYMRSDTLYSAPMVRAPGRQFRMPADTLDRPVVIPVKDSLAKIGKRSATDTTGRKTRTRPKPVATTATDSATTAMPPAIPDTMWIVPKTKFSIASLLRDTARNRKAFTEVNGKNRPKAPAIDTTEADSSAPMYFTGYHHVRIFSDSMQALCDSACYTRADSIVRMFGNPVAWARNSQITGDTILMQVDTSGIRSMYIPAAGFMTSRSGPEMANLFDQIQGETITAFFNNNAIEKMLVHPNAETMYFSKDDGGAYMGLSQASGQVMRIFFGDQSISTIKFDRDVQQKMTPMEQANLPEARLSRFKWRYDERPKTKEELFR
jgi:lipopolysaccharide export system protein LptA